MWQRWKAWWNQVWVDRPYLPGAMAGPYRIKSVLGVGSYGIAYLADNGGTEVVLKQVKPSLRNHPKGEAMQRYEQKVLQSLDHPQIPKVLDHFQYKKDSFLVMSYMKGQTLEELIFEKHRAFTEYEAVSLVKKIADIVHYLHQRGIIHRDVRIPNVILSGGTPYLIDFGLARFLGDAPTYVSEQLGSYPEEKRLKRKVEPASDLYAFGHFLLFLLYSAYSPADGQPERSWEEELTLSPQLRLMIRRLLQIDPPYADMAEWIAHLEGYLHTAKSSSTC
jgi:serine/threonine-protein kinase